MYQPQSYANTERLTLVLQNEQTEKITKNKKRR